MKRYYNVILPININNFLNIFTCGIIDKAPLRSAKPNLVASRSSITILPVGSFKRIKHDIKELFPAPVLPTIPI